MNTISLFIGIIVSLLVLFAITQLLRKLYSKSARQLGCVLAGEEAEHHVRPNRSNTLRPFESFRLNGKRIDPSEYILARVEGECMNQRGIHSGNIVFVHKLTEAERNDLKDGSILYIRDLEKNPACYLLREYIKDSSEDGKVATRFYRNGYDPKDSEPHHKLEDVIGVVRYCFE